MILPLYSSGCKVYGRICYEIWFVYICSYILYTTFRKIRSHWGSIWSFLNFLPGFEKFSKNNRFKLALLYWWFQNHFTSNHRKEITFEKNRSILRSKWSYWCHTMIILIITDSGLCKHCSSQLIMKQNTFGNAWNMSEYVLWIIGAR